MAGAGSLSADGHLTFSAGTINASTSTTTQILYSTYLPQLVTAVSLTTSGTTTSRQQHYVDGKRCLRTPAQRIRRPAVSGSWTAATVLGTQPIDSTGTATFSRVHIVQWSSYPSRLSIVATLCTRVPPPARRALSNGKATPVLTLTSPSTIFVGQSITLTARLSTSAGTPTGQIVFSAGASPLDLLPWVPTALRLLLDHHASGRNDAGRRDLLWRQQLQCGGERTRLRPGPYLQPGQPHPTRAHLPTQSVGTTSAAQILTLSNFNGTPVPVGPITISGDFAADQHLRHRRRWGI